MRHLTAHKDRVDTFIRITDGEDWAGSGFLSSWLQYKSHVNPKAQAVLVRIDPYRDWNSPCKYPDIHYVMGWSDAVVRYIPMIVKGMTGQVEEVKKIDLNAPIKKEMVMETHETSD